MRYESSNTTIYETYEEITTAIAENCDLHDARLIDMIIGSNRNPTEFALQLDNHVYVFFMYDLIEFDISCSDVENPYTFEVIIKKEPYGYHVIFDGPAMEFKAKRLEMSRRYNGLG